MSFATVQSQLVIELCLLKNVTGRKINKLYINMDVENTSKKINIITCSYSRSVNDPNIFHPKDSRSVITIDHDMISDDQRLKLEIFSKGIFSKKVMSSGYITIDKASDDGSLTMIGGIECEFKYYMIKPVLEINESKVLPTISSDIQDRTTSIEENDVIASSPHVKQIASQASKETNLLCDGISTMTENNSVQIAPIVNHQETLEPSFSRIQSESNHDLAVCSQPKSHVEIFDPSVLDLNSSIMQRKETSQTISETKQEFDNISPPPKENVKEIVLDAPRNHTTSLSPLISASERPIKKAEINKLSRRKSIGMKSQLQIKSDYDVTSDEQEQEEEDSDLVAENAIIEDSESIDVDKNSLLLLEADEEHHASMSIAEDLKRSWERRRRSLGGAARKSRLTLSTKRNVPFWDENEISVADSVKATMDERIRADSEANSEFVSAGASEGIEKWVIDSSELREIDGEQLGDFYNQDCYVMLHTIEKNSHLSWTVHIWIGQQAQGDKATIAAFKARALSKFLGNVHLIQNRENEESDQFIEMLFGNINVMEGSIASSSLRTFRKSEICNSPVRLLSIPSSESNNFILSPLPNESSSKELFLKVVPLAKASLQSDKVLILDGGGSLIYQWRGGDASHLARAKLFEAAFTLRAERIQQYPNCKIEVVDEGSEPEEFWTILLSRVAANDEDTITSNVDDDNDGDGDGDVSPVKSEDEISEQVEGDNILEESVASDGNMNDDVSEISDDDNIEYDMKEIEDFYFLQSEGHAELIRRRVANRSSILSPERSKEGLSIDVNSRDEEGNNFHLYRVGYVSGELHTSRLCGTSSEGKYYGPLRRNLLEKKGVFILDCPDEVYVWFGKQSSSDVRNAALKLGEALTVHMKSGHIKLVVVFEGKETLLFKSKFPGWQESEIKRIKFPPSPAKISSDNSKNLKNMPSIDASVKNMLSQWKQHKKDIIAEKRKIKAKAICRSVQPTSESRSPILDLLDDDDGSGVSIVWTLSRGNLIAVPQENIGHFWSHETYVILYGFNCKYQFNDVDYEENIADTRHFIIYFWQGYHCQEKGYPQWKLDILPRKKEEWISQMGEIPTEIRVTQGMEPGHFFKVFKGKYIVHYPFLNLLQQRARLEAKAQQLQFEILRHEKLRTSYMPRRRYSLKPSSLSSSPIKSPNKIATPNPFNRESSLRSLDSTVAESVISQQVRNNHIKRGKYHFEYTLGVMLFHIRGHGVCKEDVHAVQIEAQASSLNSSDCFVTIRPLATGDTHVWLWVGKGSQFYEQEAAGALATQLLKWFGENSSTQVIMHASIRTLSSYITYCAFQVRIVEEGIGEWFDRWIAKSFYRALGGYDMYTNFYLLQTPRDLRPETLRYPILFTCDISKGVYSIVTVGRRFSQRDLSTTTTAILDAHFAIFVWCGRDSSSSLRVTSMKIAKKFSKYASFYLELFLSLKCSGCFETWLSIAAEESY